MQTLGIAGLAVLAILAIAALANPAQAKQLIASMANLSSVYDGFISRLAFTDGVTPQLVKAIIAQESGFDPDAINPEKSFSLDGTPYGQSNPAGRAALRTYIKKFGNPPPGINPSIGLGQIRLTTGRSELGIQLAALLFDPLTNLQATAKHLAFIFRQGIVLDTIDAYNVGVSGLKSGRRNLVYQKRVAGFVAKFAKDFF